MHVHGCLPMELDRLYESGFSPNLYGRLLPAFVYRIGCEVRSKELELFITEEGRCRAAEIMENCKLNKGKTTYPFKSRSCVWLFEMLDGEGFVQTADLINKQLIVI